MRKLLFILALLIAAAGSLKAQTFSEWFRQKKTQKKYLLQQIAALEMYAGYGRKGYKIAKEGLGAVGGFAGSELELHTGFFRSLKMVSPAVRNYPRVMDIAGLQVKIFSDSRTSRRELSGSNALSSSEKAYIAGVFDRLLEDSERTLDELLTVTTDAALEMSDDERLRRIDQLYTDTESQYSFCQSFSRDIKSLAASRMRESRDIESSRALHGLKNKQP